MPSASGVRAGRAFIEVSLKDRIAAGAQRVQRRLQSMAAGARAMSRQLLLVGALAGAAMVPVLSTYSQFEDKLSAVKAKTGATTEELDRVRQVAKELGATTSFSAIEVAGAGEFLAQAGRTIDQIPTDLPIMLDIARAGGEEVTLPVAADIVTNVAGGFQIPDELTRVGDTVAAIAASANVSILQLGETFKLAAPAAAAAGQEIEEMAAAAGILGNSGVQASSAGTDLKNMLVVLAKNAEIAGVKTQNADGSIRDMLDVMRELGAATSGLSEAERLALFIEKFGKISAKSALILSSAGNEINRYRTIMGGAEGAASRMSKTMDDNLGGSFRALKSAVEAVGLAIAQGIGPSVRDLVDKVTSATQSLAAFIDSNPELVQSMVRSAVVIGGTGAALLTLSGLLQVTAFAFRPLSVGSKVLTGMVKPALALTRRVGGLGKLLKSVTFNPLKAGLKVLRVVQAQLTGLAIAAGSGITIGANIAALFIGDEAAMSSLGMLRDAVSNVLGGLVSSGRRAWGDISSIGTSAWSAIVNRISAGDLQGAAQVGLSALSAMWSSTVAAFTPQLTAVTIAMEDIWNSVTSIMSEMWSGFGGMFPDVTEYIRSAWSSFVGFVTGNTGAEDVELSWTGITFGISEAIINLEATALSVWESIKQAASNAASSVFSMWKKSTAGLSKLLVSIPGIAKLLGSDADALKAEIDSQLQIELDDIADGKNKKNAATAERQDKIQRDRAAAIEALDEDRERKQKADAERIATATREADEKAAEARRRFEEQTAASDKPTADDADQSSSLDDRINATRSELRELSEARRRILSSTLGEGGQPTADTIDPQSGLSLAEIQQRSIAAATRLERDELKRSQNQSPTATDTPTPTPVSDRIAATQSELDQLSQARQRILSTPAGRRGKRTGDSVDEQSGLSLSEIRKRSQAAEARLKQDKALAQAQAASAVAAVPTSKELATRAAGVTQRVKDNAGSIGTFSARAAGQFGAGSAINRLIDEAKKQTEAGEKTAENTGRMATTIENLDGVGVE